MNWFRQNRFLGLYLGSLGLLTVLSLWFLCHEHGAAKAARRRLEATFKELARLHRSIPFPSGENLRKLRAQTESYRTSLSALEQKLQGRIFPVLPLQPNEFQSQLRLAVSEVGEHAAAAKVQLPAHFNLGFDRYATSLPNLEAASPLGQELRAIEWLVNTMIDVHVDAITDLTRICLPEENRIRPQSAVVGQTKPAAAAEEKPVGSVAVEMAFSGTPSAVRRIVNELAAAKNQFYIIRSLIVKNQAGEGPKRVRPASKLASEPPAGIGSSPAPGSKEPGITFIVGTEHLDVATRIEIVQFQLGKIEHR